MNPMHLVYWALRLALPLIIVAAALPWLARLQSKGLRRGLTAALLVVSLAPNLAAALDCGWWRFTQGLEACPWLASASVTLLQIALLVVLLRRARGPAGALDWPSVPLAMAAAVTLLLFWTTHVNLELRLQLYGRQLELEAGKIAYEVLPPVQGAQANAAPLYTRIAADLFDAGGSLDLTRWSASLNPKHAEDAITPELRAALGAGAACFAELRAATRLATCRFERSDEDEMFVVAPNLQLVQLAQALLLEARLRSADGDRRAALESISAALRLGRHIAETPVLISAVACGVVRQSAFDALPALLADGTLRADDLAGFDPAPMAPARDVFLTAMRMELAYSLGNLGQFFGRDLDGLAAFDLEGLPWGARPGLDLALRLDFEAQVDGLRRAEERARRLCELDADAFAAQRAEEPLAQPRNLYADGIFAPLLVPQTAQLWLTLRRSECTGELAGCALAAARFRLEHGRYPETIDELPSLQPEVTWEGDADFARFVGTDRLLAEDPPRMELPPAK